MNMNYRLRDKIVFPKNYIPKYDIQRFDRLDLKHLHLLIDLDFIELDEYQNYAPTTQEIFNFMKKYPQYMAHGYVVTIDRDDYRTTLEGVEKFGGFYSIEEQNDFYKLFKEADELSITSNYIYCWYD